MNLQGPWEICVGSEIEVARLPLLFYLGSDDCFAALIELRTLFSLFETTVASSFEVG